MRIGEALLRIHRGVMFVSKEGPPLMNKKIVGYWVATALASLLLAYSGFIDLTRNPAVMQGMRELGYPDYVASILGVWKVLAVIALLVPGFGLVKEWAYAGVAFDLTGAAASHAFVGDPAAKVITPLVILAIVAISWWLRPASRKVSANAASNDAAARLSGRTPAIA